jgi:hypothetical protein
MLHSREISRRTAAWDCTNAFSRNKDPLQPHWSFHLKGRVGWIAEVKPAPKQKNRETVTFRDFSVSEPVKS